MARDFWVNGETLVKVRFGGHISGDIAVSTIAPDGTPEIRTAPELGLTQDPVTITPNYYHKDLFVDDFGPNVPSDVMYNLVDVNLSMNLVHYDHRVLGYCLAESMGGTGVADRIAFEGFSPLAPANMISGLGFSVGAGALMGKGKVLWASGNHLVSVSLRSPQGGVPYRFRACYLTQPPVVIPLGTERSIVQLNWRAIPYRAILGSGTPGGVLSSSGLLTGAIPEWLSTNVPIWDYVED